jgi:predicted nucleotidyltransferase
VGIKNYCAIIDTNVELLYELKKKYLNIIFDMIKLNLDNKFSMKFGVYGSYATELSIEGSDIDVGIYYEKLSKDNLNFQQELYNFLKENEKTQNELSYETIPIFTASIPRIIVKIEIDKNTKRYINNYGGLLDDDDMKFIKIDFTYNENEGYYKKNMENVDYIKNILIEYPQIKPVVQIGKRYLKRHKKNEVYTGGISSYSLFLMVLSIIIMSEIVPSKKKKIKSWYLLFSLFEIFSSFDFYWYGINEKHEYFPFGFKNDGRPFIMDPLTGLNICSNGSCSGSKINSIFKKGYDDLESAKQSYKKKFEKELSWGNNPFDEYRPIQSIVNLIKGEVE